MVHGSIKWGQSIDRIFGVAYCSRTVYQQSGVLRCGATLTVRGYRRSIILKGSSLAVSAVVSQPLFQSLPSTADLPCSDDTPVDNEDQNLLPNVLLFLLKSIWAERMDWYFGVDMAIYHTTGEDPTLPVVPDTFLSIGVERRKGGKSRLSYAVWEEAGVVPILVLEMVSQTPRGEHDEKMALYAKLGVLYYVVYNPELWGQKRHKQHQVFVVYKLVKGEYQLQQGEPYWMPEVGLGIGRCQVMSDHEWQEQLGGFDEQGDTPAPSLRERYLTAEERAAQEKRQRERLEACLRSTRLAHPLRCTLQEW